MIAGRASWADQVVDATEDEGRREHLQGHVGHLAATATSDSSVEVVFALAGDGRLRGLRLDVDMLRTGPELLRDRTPDDIAFYLVQVGVCEPKADDEFLQPDEHGVAWLRMDRWLDDLRGDDEMATPQGSGVRWLRTIVARARRTVGANGAR